MTHNLPFQNKVALVTGSSRGIGLATATALASQGARVMLCGRSPQPLEEARRRLQAQGLDVASMAADVAQAAQAEALVQHTLETFGRLDMLVNNAGVSMRANLAEMDAASCEQVVATNLLGCVHPTRCALAALKKSQGSVVFVSSIAGLVGLPTGSLYCATKTALRGFADALRCELAPDHVHVGVVYVGFTQNDPQKTVLGGHGQAVAPERPGHMSQARVAQAIARLIARRQRQVVLTPIGKLAQAAAWLSPVAVEQAIVLSRKHGLNEVLGIR